MIISYLTETYFEWGKIFVDSFSLFHPDHKIHLNTRNLTKRQIKILKSKHKNIIIENSDLDIEKLSKKHNISVDEITKSKIGCNSAQKHGHRLGMNITADGDRIESYLHTIKKYENEDFFLLTDIDLLFRKKLDLVFKQVMENDVGLKIRPGKGSNIPNKLNTNGKSRDALINIGTVSIRNNENGIKFVKRGIYHLNSSPMKQRSGMKGGQYTIAKTFNDFVGQMSFFKFPSRTFSPYLKTEAPVGFFKSKKKERDLKTATEELKRVKGKT